MTMKTYDATLHMEQIRDLAADGGEEILERAADWYGGNVRAAIEDAFDGHLGEAAELLAPKVEKLGYRDENAEEKILREKEEAADAAKVANKAAQAELVRMAAIAPLTEEEILSLPNSSWDEESYPIKESGWNANPKGTWVHTGFRKYFHSENNRTTEIKYKVGINVDLDRVTVAHLSNFRKGGAASHLF